MIEEKEIKTQGAGSFARAAVIDAERYSDECRMLYTPKQRCQAETFKDIVQLAYSAKNYYITFRKGFVAIKIDTPVVKDTRVVRELDQMCEERGYEKVRSAQGLVYRIPRK